MHTNEPASKSDIGELKSTRAALPELQSALLKLYGKRAPLMIIYGSHARKDSTESSDIDVLLIYPHSVKPGEEIARLSATLADLNLRYQVLVSILPISETDYSKAKSPLLKNIHHEGVTLEFI